MTCVRMVPDLHDEDDKDVHQQLILFVLIDEYVTNFTRMVLSFRI